LGKTAAKAAHEQVRAHERRRGERHERDKGREREDQDGDHGELGDEQKKEHGPDDDDAVHPLDCVAHAIERPAALESAFEPPQPATAPAVAASTTIDAVR
jgi:hypothetical protein